MLKVITLMLPYISETDFMLSELRYTLVEVGFQLAHLQQTPDDIFEAMIETEHRYQALYARLLVVAIAEVGGPVGERREELERLRQQTIGLLEGAANPWPAELIDAVKQQLAEDRERATELADRRPSPYGRVQDSP